MLGEDFYEQVKKRRSNFLIISIIAIVFNAGITFTFVIPALKGFKLISLLIALLLYFMVANIFVGLFKETYESICANRLSLCSCSYHFAYVLFLRI